MAQRPIFDWPFALRTSTTNHRAESEHERKACERWGHVIGRHAFARWSHVELWPQELLRFETLSDRITLHAAVDSEIVDRDKAFVALARRKAVNGHALTVVAAAESGARVEGAFKRLQNVEVGFLANHRLLKSETSTHRRGDRTGDGALCTGATRGAVLVDSAD